MKFVGRARLEQLIEVVDRGFRSFVEAGKALDEIRSRRLYRLDGHRSFDSFIKEHWNLTRQRASQLIRAARVVESLGLSTTVDIRERQIRELTRLPEPEEQAEVFEEAKAAAALEDRPITTRDVKWAVDRRLTLKRNLGAIFKETMGKPGPFRITATALTALTNAQELKEVAEQLTESDLEYVQDAVEVLQSVLRARRSHLRISHS